MSSLMEFSSVSQQAVGVSTVGVMSQLDGEGQAPVWCPRPVSYGWNQQPQLFLGQKSLKSPHGSVRNDLLGTLEGWLTLSAARGEWVETVGLSSCL